MIDVGMLSIGEDFAGIESISFLTSSTVGGSGSRKGKKNKRKKGEAISFF